jgi:hypothetical protein
MFPVYRSIHIDHWLIKIKLATVVAGFAVVFTAVLPGEHEKIVVKKLLDSNLEERKLLPKDLEARLINQLNHANIIEFKRICLDRYALLMDNVTCSGYAF